MSRSSYSIAFGLLIAPLAFAQIGIEGGGTDPDSPNAILTLRSGEVYDRDHAKLIKSAEAVGALGPDLFGESINFYTGATEFHHTDLSVPGNSGLSVAVSRRLSVEGDKVYPFSHSLGDWELDVPYIGGIFMAEAGWKVSVDLENGGSALRCRAPTSVAEAQPVGVANGGDGFDMREFWRGYSMYVPGVGEQPLLLAGLPGTTVPASGGPYPWVTNNFWQLSCTTLTNPPGSPHVGDGFVALAPDGTKYHFTHMVQTPHLIIGEWGLTDLTGVRNWVTAPRSEIRIYATRVQDRFGNEVHYSWTNDRLDSITSNDGRVLTFSYYPNNGPIRLVTEGEEGAAGARTVRYHYTEDSLDSVTYADDSKWTLSMRNVYADHYYNCASLIGNGDPFRCWDPNSPHCGYKRLLSIEPPSSGTMTHPSGATGIFHFQYKRHIRAGVPETEGFCPSRSHPGIPGWPNITPAAPDEPWEFSSLTPRVFDVMAIVAKEIQGPGVDPDQKWSYDYTNPVFVLQPPFIYHPDGTWTVNPLYVDDYAAATRKVQVTEPGGILRDFTFGNRYDVDEGHLLKVETFKDGDSVHTTSNAYLTKAEAIAAPFPERVGTNPLWTPDNIWGEWLLPLRKSATSQDAVLFEREVLSFNQFASPEEVWHHSPLGTRTDRTEYENNLNQWVLGLPKRKINLDTGVNGTEVSRTEYNAKAQPTAQYSFNQFVTSFAYHPDGNLLSATDGKFNTTLLNNYYRGVPREIRFANNRAITAEVNVMGRLDNTKDVFNTITSYGYDNVGRLNRVAYAPDVEVTPATSWLPRILAFAHAAPGDPYQLPDGHWQQTIETGSAKTTTHFDALWRPILVVTEAPGATKSIVVKRYDVRGREAFTSYPVETLANINDVLAGTYTEYDALDRVKTITVNSELGNLVTTTDYLGGLKTRVTSPRGRLANPAFHTITSYQAFDTPSYDAPVLIEAPEGVTTVIERDVFGKPLSVTRSGPGG